MATEADVPVAISIATGEGLDRSLKTEKLDRTDNQCSPGTLNESKGDLDQHPEIHTEKHSADGDNVQVEYSMEVESKNNSFGISESEQFFDTLSETSQVEQSNEAGMEIVQNELQLQKGTHVGEPVETSTVENEVFEESKEKFAEDIENHDVAIGAGIISEITKTGDAKLDVEELEASTNETTVDQHVQEMSNQQDSIKEDVDVQCLEKEAEISDADIKGAEKADGNAESYHKEASDPLEATAFEEYKASISTDDVTNSSFKKDIELETNVTSNHEEDSQQTLQNYEQKDEVQTLPEVTPENAKTELAFENAEVISCKEEAIAIQNTPIVLEKEEANPVHCPKENDNTTEEVSEAASIEHEVVEHALPEIQTAENQPQELSEEKCRDHQASVEEAHLSTDKDEKNWDEQAIQEKSSSLVEEEASQQISREEEVQATNLKEEDKEADTKCEEPIEVADTTREIGFETIEQKTETNTDLYVPIPEEKAYAEESTNTFVEDNSFLSEVPEVQTKEIIQEDHSTVSGYGLVSVEVSQVSALEEAEAEKKEHVNNTPEQKGPQTILTDETVVETEDHAQAGNNYNSQTIEKNIETVEDEGNADAGIAHAECLATIVPDQPALHVEDIELQARENIDSKDKLEEQIPAAADEGGKLLIEAQTENNEQITDTDVIASEEMNPETTLTGETTLDSKDVDVQEERNLSSEENLEKQLPDVEDKGDTCLKESEEEKEQETLPTIVTREPPVDIEVTDVQAGESFSPEKKLEELIPTAADEGDTGLKEAKEENKEQVKSIDSDPEEKVTILTDERALNNKEVELQVEKNVSSKDNVEEQIPTKADEGDAGLKDPKEGSFSPEEKLEELIATATDEGNTGLKEADDGNKEQVKITDSDPEERVTILTDERALDNEEQVEENVVSKDNVEEQIPTKADKGDAGLKEPEEDSKEPVSIIDISSEEKGLETFLTDGTKAGECINSKEIGTESFSTEPQEENEEKVAYTDISPEEKIVNLQEQLEEQGQVVADEGDTGLNEAKTENKEHIKSKDIAAEENGLPIISKDVTALHSDKIELQSEEYVSSADNLEKHIPTPSDEAESGLAEAEIEYKEQATITDGVNNLPEILTDQTALESDEIELRAEENVMSTDYLVKEIPTTVDEGKDILTDAKAESKEQVTITDITPEETILTDERSLETEETNVQVKESANSNENLAEEISAAPELGDTCLKKEDEEENKEQVESSSHEEKDHTTILTEETSQELEYTEVKAIENFNSEEILEKQIPTAIYEGETDMKEVAENKKQVETTEIATEEKDLPITLADENVEGIEVIDEQAGVINSKEVLEKQIATALDEGEMDSKAAEKDIKEQVETTDIVPEQKGAESISSGERVQDLEDVHAHEQENFNENLESQIPTTVGEGETDLNEGEVENKEEVKCSEIAAEEKDVTTILRDETALEIQDVEEKPEEAGKGEESSEVLNDILVDVHNTEQVDEATVEQSHGEAEPKITIEDGKSEDNPERNHMTVQEVLDEPKITSQDFNDDQIIESNVASSTPESIEEDIVKSSQHNEKETTELKEEGSTNKENASDHIREYILEDATVQIKDEDYNAVKLENKIIEDSQTAEVDEICEAKNIEKSEDILSTLPVKYDEGQQGEGSNSTPTEAFREESINEDTLSMQVAKDDGNNGVVTVTEKSAEVPSNDEEDLPKVMQKYEPEGEITKLPDVTIEETTLGSSSESVEVITCTKEEIQESMNTTSGEVLETITTKALPEIQIVEDTTKTTELQACVKAAELSTDGENEISEEQTTCEVSSSLVAEKSEENSKEEEDTVKSSQAGEKEMTELNEEGISKESVNDENASELSPEYKVDALESEEEILEVSETEETLDTLPVALLLQKQVQNNIDEDTFSVQHTEGNDSAVIVTDISSEVPSNDEESQVLQKYEQEEELTKLRDVLPEEMKPEPSNENAEVVTCTNEGTQESLEKENDTNESNTSTVKACTEVEEEEQTTREISSSPIGEVTAEESSKEEKKEAHEECKEAIEGPEEESSKPDVEDGSILLKASEEVIEKEIQGECFDSGVVSDEREQVETTHIAPEEKEIGGTDVYNTELVRESVVELESSPQVQTHEEVAEPISKVEDETDKSNDPPENSDKISDEVLQESQKDDRDEEIKEAGHNDDYNGTVVLPEAGEEVTSIGEEPSEVTQILKLGEKHAQVEGSNDEIEVCELEDKVYAVERTEKETREVEVSNLALEKPNPDAPEGETIERCEVVPESDSKGIDEVAEDEVTVDQTFDEGVSKEPSTLLSEEKEIIASEHEHTKEVEVPTEEDTGDKLAARSAEEICLPEEPTELEVSELAPEKLDAGETEEETKKTSEMVTVSDSQSIGAVCEDEIITDQTQCDGEKELEDSEVQESLDADAPAEETKDSSAVVLKSDSESIDGLVKEVIIADQTLTEGISKEQLQMPSTALLPEEKELESSEYEHETKSADKTIEEENPKEVEVPADEDKQESVTLTPTETCLHTEEPRDTESAPHKLDAGETEEEIKGTSETVTISDSQTAVVASGDEIVADQTICEETTETALSKERELETSELGLEKLAAVDIEEIKEGPEIVPIIDSGIIEVVSNDEITIDQTLNEGIMKEQIPSPSSTLLPEEKEHETSEPEHETTAQDESTEQDCTEDLEVSANEDTQALLAARPVEEECSQKEEPSKLNVSEMAVEKLDAGETEDANETFGAVSTSDFPRIVAEPKEDIIVDETLSKGVTDIPLEISSYSSLHQEKELKAYELDLEKADAVTPEEVVGSEVIPQSISQSSCEVSKDETVADQLETPSPTLLPDEKEHKASVHEHGTMIDEKNQEDENLKEVNEPTDEASEYVFVARSVEETCLQKEEPSALKVAEANEYEEVKEPFESVSESDSQSINAVSKDDSIADQTVSNVITNMPLDTPLPNENEEVKEDATELALEKLDTDGTDEVKEGSEVTPKSDLQSIDVVVKDEMITDQVLPESITTEQLLVQPSTLLPEEKELKEVDEHKHGTATQDKNPEEEYAKETEVVADEDTRDVYVASSEETTHLQKEESRELNVSELSPECEEEITATFESTDAVSKEETIAEQLVHQHDEQFLSSSTLVPKEEEEATVPKEEPEDCKVLESSLKGEPEEETKEAFEPAPEVSPQSIGELATDEIVDQIPPSSLIYEEKRCENTTTINNAGDESMNVVETPNDESRKDPHSAVETSIQNEDPRNVSDLEFPSSQYTERDSSNEEKILEVATSVLRTEDSCQTPIEENLTPNIEVLNKEIGDEKEVAKDSQLISVSEENVRESQQENESTEEKYPEEKSDAFTAPIEYQHQVPVVDETGSLNGDIEKEVKPDVKSFKDLSPDEADGMNCESSTTQVTYPVETESGVEISQGVLGVEEANGTTQDKKQLEKESYATDIPSSKDEALNYVQGPKLEEDTLVARESKEEKICDSGTETVDSTAAQISTKERVEVVTHLTEEKEPTVGKELQSDEEEEEHEVEDAKTDEEKEDTEHKRAHQGYDEPVIVEASRDTEVKVTPKKSHNILSGVGKSVKHSISKVKKAIIGKSSHSKTQAEK